MIIKNGSVWCGNDFVNRDVCVDGAFVSEYGTGEIIDVSGGYVVPGFFDIHTHGAVGIDVNCASADDYEAVCAFFAVHGVTDFLASIVADDVENTERAIGAIVEAMRRDYSGAKIRGIHLEGPFLNPLRCGAISFDYIKSVDLDLFLHYLKLSDGALKYITVAPELDGADEFIRIASENGVAVALGHSDVSYEDAMLAKTFGASAVTHLYNAMSGLHHRTPGLALAGLSGNYFAEIICDGAHVHRDMVALAARNVGLDKLVCVTDSMMAAGMPDGRYKLGANDVILNDIDAFTPSGVRAGSVLTMEMALKNLVKFTGISLADALGSFAQNQARLLHMSDIGALDSGKRANITVLDMDLNIVMTIVDGRTVYRR